MTDDQVTTGQIFERLGAVLRENSVPLVGCVLALSMIDTALDQYATPGRSILPSSIASFVAQYYLTARALERRGLRTPGVRQFGSFFGLSLLSGLGLLLGFLLLIVPGVYLGVRWSVANSALLAEGKSASDALSESWEMTARSFWAILGAYLVILLPAVALGTGLAVSLETVWPIPSSFIANIVTLGAFAVSWLAGVATYSLLRPGEDPLVEIFA